MVFALVLSALVVTLVAGTATGLQSFPDGRWRALRARVATASLVASVALWLAVIAVGIAFE